MFDRAVQNIGDRLDPSVGVPWKPAQEIFGAFVAEIVQQKERIQHIGVLKAKGSVQFYAGALHRGNGFRGSGNRSDRHMRFLSLLSKLEATSVSAICFSVFDRTSLVRIRTS